MSVCFLFCFCFVSFSRNLLVFAMIIMGSSSLIMGVLGCNQCSHDLRPSMQCNTTYIIYPNRKIRAKISIHSSTMSNREYH